MDTHMLVPYVLLLCRGVTALILIIGGIGKLARLADLRRIVSGHKLLPEALVPALSVLLPILELTIGLAILLNVLQPTASIAAAVLFLFFAAIIAGNLLSGRADLNCGCFGSRASKISWRLIVRNLGLAVAALIVVSPDQRGTLMSSAFCVTIILSQWLWTSQKERSRVQPSGRTMEGKI